MSFETIRVLPYYPDLFQNKIETMSVFMTRQNLRAKRERNEAENMSNNSRMHRLGSGFNPYGSPSSPMAEGEMILGNWVEPKIIERINPVEAFNNFLEANAKKWTEDMRGRIGLKFIKIPGEVLRTAVYVEKWAKLWSAIKSQLPEDACLMDFPKQPSYLIQCQSGELFFDAHLIMFGSREWDKIDEGAPIPIKEISLSIYSFD